ncbi:hypothetical protein ACHAXN_011535 [Cyclotella atomus]|jgi:cytochrome c heme-lyase
MASENDRNATSSATAASSCPVMKRSDGAAQTPDASGGLWSRFFPRSKEVHKPASSDSTAASACPIKGNAPIPASIEEAAKHSQLPSLGQKIPLSTQREISSIPRGDESAEEQAPSHQPDHSSKWMYPSEQQLYNAMLKKGYRPPIESIPDVLRIHNAVNERSWLQVCKWEKELHGNSDPKLVRFVGRPKDLSPKAWFNSRILFTQEPFDRHDWYVEAENGEARRYVIDFYEGKEKSSRDVKTSIQGGPIITKPPSMYIDARPALDNPSAAVDRMVMALRETLPGIASAYDSYKLSSSNTGGTVDANAQIKAANQTERQ